MASKNLLLLAGDGIGPESMAEVRKLIEAMNDRLGSGFLTQEGLVGGCAYDAHGQAISDADMEKAMAAGIPVIEFDRQITASRHLLPGPCRLVLAQAGRRRRPRHPDRP